MSQSFRFRRLAASLTLATCAFAALSAPNAFAIIASTPVVTSIARLQPGPLTNSSTVIWRVTFSESVTGVDATDFTLTPLDGSATGTISAVSGSGTEYTVTVSSLSGIGTLRLDMNSSGTGIANATGTAPSGGFTYGQVYTHIMSAVPVVWGGENQGQFGNNTVESFTNTPTGVLTSGALKGKLVVAISSGAGHCLALTSDGQVFAWGDNSHGQLGNNSTIDSTVPVAVTMAGALSGKTVVAISAGVIHSLALTSDGAVFAWGYNYSGAIGDGSYTDSNVPVPVKTTGALSGKVIVAIATGFHESVALSSEGEVYTWGFNMSGQLGVGYIGPSIPEPTAVDTSGVLSGKSIVAIAGTSQTILALSSDGEIYVWGRNEYSSFGTSSADSYSAEPVAIMASGVLSGKTAVALATGLCHSVVLTSDGLIYTWGKNDHGQLGNNSTTDSSIPVAVTMTGALSGKTVVEVSATGLNSLARTSDGTAYYWGNKYPVSIGGSTVNLTPVAVDASTSTGSALAERTVYSLAMNSYADACFALASQSAVSTVSIPATSWYKEGGMLALTMNFPQAVAVDTTSGTPRIALTVGSTTRYATYTSGTGTTALAFTYTVQAGDTDTDGIAVASTAIDLNSGSLTDIAGNAVDLTLPSLNTSGIKIDIAAPDTSITSTPAATTTDTSATFAVTGSDTGGSDVTGYQVQIDNGGFAAAASPVSYSGLALGSHTFQVRAVDAAGNTDASPASYTWNIVAPGTAIPDGYGASATGGGTASAISVSTAADFVTQATSSSASVITVVGSLDIGTVAVASNKTIQGADASATLDGCLNLSGVSNVIIRGLNLANGSGPAIALSGASKVFVTHCTFLDCSGEQLSLLGSSDNVTVSWCEFASTASGQASVQIGSAAATAPLHVTLHHNWWSTKLASELPLTTYGFVHQYSNYLACTGNTTATVAADHAQLLSERNVFTSLASPLTKTGSGVIRTIDNVYTSCTGTASDAGTDTVFTPSYTYEMLATSDVPTTITALAGNTAGAAYSDESTGAASITGPTTAVTSGTAATLTAVASGLTANTYQWRLNNTAISGATAGTYTITSMSSSQAGTYTVAVGLADGSAVVSTPLQVSFGAASNTGTDTGGSSNTGGSGSSSSGSSGGGGALASWLLAALALLAAGRRCTQCSS